MRLCVLLLAISLLCPVAASASVHPVVTEDQAKIAEILGHMPSQDGNLGNTISKYGLRVASIIISEADEEDVVEASSQYKIGDNFVDIYFAEPLPSLPCKIGDKASFVYREGNYLPESATAVWLMKGECKGD